jgi:hypothetical protein
MTMIASMRLLLAATMLLVAGCATGPMYSEMKSKITPLAAGQGRVFVYRDSSLGAAITPKVNINGKVVGVSRGNGFFYTDLPAGEYRLAAETEVERSLTFSLAAGETKYVRASISLGFFVGRLNFDLVNRTEGEQALGSLAYSPEL